MSKVNMIPERCPQNHYCPVISVCPAGAISQQGPFGAPEINYSKCTSCGKCARFCGYGAFSISKE